MSDLAFNWLDGSFGPSGMEIFAVLMPRLLPKMDNDGRELREGFQGACRGFSKETILGDDA